MTAPCTTTPRSTALRRGSGVLLLLALASGCGIRPTAVPVDGGAPASRTACPTAPHVPTAPATPTPAGTLPSSHAAKSGPSPSPAPTTSATPLPGNAFSAVPTAAANACK
ncbi:hypothetical protein F7Q99_09800 [Streptomyces kaniharaensis]|uniref:Uncharacterized protein n=1 Tax=Streptomyces kaniharaensis TaxID=212423 RepID=A0A6N7KM16_9ACTN|nr:hypothetical protein [Streptomyces kaniharaensis]MQS12572.1 hypothetical protein [Streptomyces kaniharaensis]